MESTKDEVSIPVQQEQTDAHLDDDRQPQEGQFVGATLKIDGDLAKDEHEVRFSGQAQTEPGSGFDRNRPGSTIGRQSVRSTSSRTSLRPGGYISPKTSDKFFSYKVKLQSMKWFVFSTVKQSKPVYQHMTSSPWLGVAEMIILWHIMFPLLLRSVAFSPRPLGIGMHFQTLLTPLLNVPRMVLLSSLLW